MESLRKYQNDCFEAVVQELDKNIRKTCVVIPTSGGKTHIFMAIADYYVKINPTKKVLIISHLSILTTQTKTRFKDALPELEVGILQADNYPSYTSQVVISTMQSSRVDDKIISWMVESRAFGKNDGVGLIIIDEVHQALCESYDTILKYFPEAKVVGFTATPYKSGYLMTNYFDSVAYTISMEQLINEGWLVEPKLHQIAYDHDDAENPHDAASNETRIAHVIELYKRLENGNKSIVFLSSIDEAKTCATSFRDNNFVAECVTSDVTGTYRDDILEEFRVGNVQVLTTVNVLTAGFDAPCIKSIFMPYGTKSPTQYMQRIGRGLRPFKDKTCCNIYCYGSTPSIKKGSYQKIHEQVLFGVKKKMDIFDELAVMDAEGNIQTTEYKWTKNVILVAEKLKALGCKQLYDMIIYKDFPVKFMRNLDIMIKNLPNNPVDMTKGRVTFSQKRLLESYGFTEEKISTMTLGDANTVVAMINKMRKDAVDGTTFIVASGKYTGKHVKDLNPYYKRIILSDPKYRNSIIYKQIKAWEQKMAAS